MGLFDAYSKNMWNNERFDDERLLELHNKDCYFLVVKYIFRQSKVQYKACIYDYQIIVDTGYFLKSIFSQDNNSLILTIHQSL